MLANQDCTVARDGTQRQLLDINPSVLLADGAISRLRPKVKGILDDVIRQRIVSLHPLAAFLNSLPHLHLQTNARMSKDIVD